MNEEFLNSLGLQQEVMEKILGVYNAEKLQNALDTELEAAGVSDMKAAKLLLEKQELTQENMSEKIIGLKNEHPLLFKANTVKIVSSAQAKEGIEKGIFEKMSYKERLDLFKKNPDVYKKLVE